MRTRYVLVALLTGLALVGCDGKHSTTDSHPALKNYNAQGLSFTYPTTWNAVGDPHCPVTAAAPGPPLLRVFLSNQALGPPSPCVPVPLLPRGLVVTWSQGCLPGRSPCLNGALRPPVTPTRIGGRPATEHIGHTDACDPTNPAGTTLVSAIIEAGDNTMYRMDACLRGPDLKASEAQVQAMLASAKVTG